MSTTEIVIGVVGVVFTLVASHWALIKIAVGQFSRMIEARFQAQDEAREAGRAELRLRLDQIEADNRRQERDHLKLLADLPMLYVRREDHIRFDTVINAKLDALNARLELMAERQLADRRVGS